jgi:hypothetical protein
MDSRKRTLYNLGVSLFRQLTGIYPGRFRQQFAGEILEVLLQRLDDANAGRGAAISACIFHESIALMASIIREHWHERWEHREARMVGEERLNCEIARVFLKRKLKSAGKVVILLAVLIVLFIGCSYAYAGIQIAQAKHLGIYPTLEDAVYSLSSGEYGGAMVIRVDINHTEPCFSNGNHSYVMCVTSTVFYNQNPDGLHHSKFSDQSAYFHLKEGWVQLSIEVLPRYIFRVVELLGMQVTSE